MPLIAADNTLMLWAFIMLAAATAILLERRTRWAANIPGAVTALLIAAAASNMGLIPTDAPVYDAVWAYIVPLSIPLLLFQIDIRSLWQESRRLLLLFLISSAATVAGALLGFVLLRGHIAGLDKITAMIAASYTGGGVNFAAMTAKLQPSESLTAATIVADNLMMACYFLVLIMLAGSAAAKRIWGSQSDTAAQPAPTVQDEAAAPSLENIAASLGLAILLVAVSFSLSAALKNLFSNPTHPLAVLFTGLFTDKYLLLTTFTLVATFFLRGRAKLLSGSQDLGMYGIYLFFVVIGIPASVPLIIQTAPLLFVFTLTVALTNLLLTLLAAKLLKYRIEEVVMACNANIGGPTTAAALAVSRGWHNLTGPILLIGTLGYIIGNYIGVAVYTLISYI